MKKTILGLSCGLTMLGASCIGPNNAFNQVNNWNAHLTKIPIVNELLYFVMWWIPVYPIVWLGDQLIFNSVEFWGGENPIPRAEEFSHPEGGAFGN